jgi:hypothetical protein
MRVPLSSRHPRRTHRIGLFKGPGQFTWNNFSLADPRLKFYPKLVEFPQLFVELLLGAQDGLQIHFWSALA